MSRANSSGIPKVEPVYVFVRLRPEELEGENEISNSQSLDGSLLLPSQGKKCVTILDSSTVRLTPPDGTHAHRRSVAAIDDKKHKFDHIFDTEATQEDIYAKVSPHVRATAMGYNTTIFAYGSTGSGKSYTMTGNSDAPGVIPRAISEIFSVIEQRTSEETEVFFYVRISYVELYNNTFRNLLEFVANESSTETSTAAW